MKESEIKKSIEKIHWALLGILDMIDRPNDVLLEHLEMLADETTNALNLVISLCDYMIDDGAIDLTEDLEIIHKEAVAISNGEFDRIPKEALTDVRQPLFAKVLNNAGNMWVEIQRYWEWVETAKKPTSDTNGMEMGSNTTNSTETPQTPQKGANVAIMRPYTHKKPGRPKNIFGDTIAAKYKKHVELIQEYTRNELQSLNAPNAVVALFIAYRRKDILKQCPSYRATLRLLGIEAKTDKEARKLCPFGGHQNYGDLRKKYFNKEDGFASLNETDSTQDGETKDLIQQAMEKAEALLKKLEPPTEQKEALQGA